MKPSAADAQNAPISFWLKKADKAITRHTADALAQLGLERTDWQMLHLIHEAYSHATQPEIFATMHPYITKGKLSELILNMKNKGWLTISATTNGGKSIQLTPEGKAIFAKATSIQDKTRATIIEGIDSADYATSIAVLRRICSNLETLANKKPGPV